MEITKPLPRESYSSFLNDLNGECAFCKMSSALTITEYTHWTWVYAAFPYRKYHSLLVPKRHIKKISELLPEELIEFSKIIDQIEESYRKSDLISFDSPYGDQLFISWRSRFKDEGKASVAHFHVHFYPKFAKDEELALDPEAHDIDSTLLESSI